MYKDSDRQREAVREATRRYRAKNRDSALSGQKDCSGNARGLAVVDKVGDTQPVIPKSPQSVIPRPAGLSNNQWAYIQMRAEQNE